MRRNALLLAGILCGCLFALELMLRVAGVGFPATSMPDPQLGFALRPGVTGWYGKEGGSDIRVNEQGRRDRGFPLERSPGTFRVAVIGDSFVTGLEVAEERGLVAALERDLTRCPALNGAAPEAMNFGVPGYGTAQELLMLRTRALAYRPDAVVLVVFPGNDVRNNFRPLQRDPVRPYFELRDGALRLDDAFKAAVERRLKSTSWIAYAVLDHSRLAQAINELRRAPLPFFGGRPEVTNVLTEAGTDAAIYAPSPPDAWRDAWLTTEAIVVAFAGEVRQAGAAFLLATIGAAVEVDPDPARRHAFASALNLPDLDGPDRRFAALSQRDGFAFLPMAALMRPEAERTGTHFHGFANTRLGTGHYNEAGHAFAGKAMAEALCTAVARTPGLSVRGS